MEFTFRDYNIRVWTGDVFIDCPNVFAYSGGVSGEGMQAPTENQELKNQLIDTCRNIKAEFFKLDALIDDASIERN